jgi:hypothetical protein
MNAWRGWVRLVFLTTWTIVISSVGIFVSCGTVGPLVAPEDIGVNIKRQKDAQERERLEKEARLRKDQEEKGKPVPEREGVVDQPTKEEKAGEPNDLDQAADPAARPDGAILVPPR